MSRAFSHCSVDKSDPLIKVVDGKNRNRKVIFKNPERVAHTVTRVDDCVIKEGKRVDFLVSVGQRASVLVELKGNGVEYACNQIRESMCNADLRSVMGEK